MPYGKAKASVNGFGDLTGQLVIRDEAGSVVFDGQIASSLSAALSAYGWIEVPGTDRVENGWLKLKVDRR